MLDNITTPIILPAPDIDDGAVVAAVRCAINGNIEDASCAIRSLPTKIRIMIENLRNVDNEHHFSNYSRYVGRWRPASQDSLSKSQKSQGIKPDHPDIVIKVRGQETLFGEVTGPAQAGHSAKNAWDKFRLVRFTRSFIDSGNKTAPLIQVIDNCGTYMRLQVKTRGMFYLEEVGSFEVPTKISSITSLVTTLPTLLEAQVLSINVFKLTD
ncbi:hypothetical protein BGX26_005586, partial [Mortierella sp. AD094]